MGSLQIDWKNLIEHVNITALFLSRQNSEDLLDRIIIADEKWMRYKNIHSKEQWLDEKYYS